jgi:uncharacterized membrane protein YbhN (UPF0104 family)
LAFTSETIKKISIVASWGLFLAFIFFVEWQIGWITLVSSWQSLSVSQLFLAVLFIVLTYLLRALRFFDYFDLGENSKVSKWLVMIRLTLLHNVLNNFLPARTGEVSFPVLMKRYFSIPYHHSLPALLWFRVLDLHTLLSVAILPFFLLYMPLSVATILFILWLLLPMSIYLLKSQFLVYVENASNESSTWKEKALMLLEGLPKSYQAFFRSWFLTVANWLLKLMVLVWIMLQFLEIPYSVAVEAVIAGELTSILPFHAPAGVGTYEAGIVAVIMSAQHVIEGTTGLMTSLSFEMATSAAINVHLFILGASILGGIIAWFLPRKQWKNVQHD